MIAGRKYIQFIFISFFVLINNSITAQNYIEGYLYDNISKEPIEAVSVINTLSDNWAISNKIGYFKIKFEREYNILFKILGKETKTIRGTSDQNISLKIYLKDKDLALEEIVVTANKDLQREVGSSIILDKYGISQFQTFSLAEILQQLPGIKITPINLNSPNVISLRTANSTKNNRFGVSYILDEMPLSNDENMDQYYSKGRTPYSNINDGYDLRNIPSSNIEKIEIISGIPDAKYGNVTSGVVKIDRKAGVSSLRITSKVNGGTFATSIDKGFKINDKWGNLSLSLDYLKSDSDPRKNLENFNRITFSGIWSSIIKGKYKNTLSITLRNNFDELKVDKEFDKGTQEAKHKKDKGFNVSNRGSFTIDSKFLDYINFQIGSSYSKSETYRQSFINTGGKVVPIAQKTSLMPGIYTPVAYLHKQQVFSTPFNINGRIIGGKNMIYNLLLQKISLGVDFKYSDNVGRGKIYNPETAASFITLNSNTNSRLGLRPLDFGEYIIPRRSLGIFFQDNITYTFKNKQKIYANLGLRYDNQNGFSSFGPRINMAYEYSKNIKIRGGIGFSSKAPSLANVFPGDKHYDILIRDIRTNFYSFNLVQTFVNKIPINPLKPSKIWKYEIGADIKTNLTNITFTAYYNKMFDGFVSQSKKDLYGLPKIDFEYPNGKNHPPTYSVVRYTPYIISYEVVKNGSFSVDKGIELFINFKKIKFINTSFAIIGQYTHTKIENSFPIIKKTQNLLEKEYVYGYYHNIPSVNDDLSFRLVSTYHNSDLRLLISLTSEFFIQSVKYATISDIYPYGYENIHLAYKEIRPEERKDRKYEALWLQPISTKNVKTPFYSNYHLRVTKEMLNGLSLSFYSTNFLNHIPKIEINGMTTTPNAQISFGGSIKYIF